MARRKSTKRPYGEPHPELDVEKLKGGMGARLERGPGGEEYRVAVARRTDKTFICPACSQEIPGNTHHVVAWAEDGLFGAEVAAEQRRHWHQTCWDKFGRTGG